MLGVRPSHGTCHLSLLWLNFSSLELRSAPVSFSLSLVLIFREIPLLVFCFPISYCREREREIVCVHMWQYTYVASSSISLVSRSRMNESLAQRPLILCNNARRRGQRLSVARRQCRHSCLSLGIDPIRWWIMYSFIARPCNTKRKSKKPKWRRDAYTCQMSQLRACVFFFMIGFLLFFSFVLTNWFFICFPSRECQKVQRSRRSHSPGQPESADPIRYVFN